MQLPHSNEMVVIFEETHSVSHHAEPSAPHPPHPQTAISSSLVHNCKAAVRSLRFCNHFTFVSAIDFLACEGKERMSEWVGSKGGRGGASGGRQQGSQRMCNARLTYCHHDNRHHFTGAALRMPVWVEVT